MAVAISVMPGCHREEPGRAPPPRKPAPPPLEAGTLSPNRDDEASRSTPSTGARGKEARAPAHGCVVRRTVALGAPFERGYAGFLDGAPLVVGVGEEGRALLTLDPAAASAQPPRLALEAKLAKGALFCQRRCQLAYVDARARLTSVALDAGHIDVPVSLARGVDRRFSPAIALVADKPLVAYTSSVGETMHTFVVPASGGAPRDLTPEGHGAAAATFILGADPASLVMIDARAGISPLLEITFDPQGAPSEARVGTPVSQPSVPPLLAAVQRTNEVEVFYRVIGKLAMTAIGRVPLREARTPAPLFPSRGYGELELSIARGRRIVLVAAEVPVASPPTAPRTLVLKLLDDADARDVLTFGSALQPAARPSIAAAPEGGTFLLAYVQEHTLVAASIACDDR